MVPSERRSGTNSTRVTWTTLTPVPEAQIKNAYESYATTLASMDGDAARDRVWAGATEFQRLVGREAKSGQLYEQDGVVASVVPGVQSSFFNAAVLREHPDYPGALERVAQLYSQAGEAKWGVWTDPANDGAAAALSQAGLVLDSSPVLMAAELSDVDLSPPAEPAHPVDLEALGAVNDIAYDHPPQAERAFAGPPPPGTYATGVHRDGELAAVTMVLDVGDDAFVTFVATLPEHRGQGLAATLIRQALAEAQHRGRTTTSLQASKLGQGIYARLGYRPLGEQHLWELRP